VKSLQSVAQRLDRLVHLLILHTSQSTGIERLAFPQAREPILQADFLLTARTFYRLTRPRWRMQSAASWRGTPRGKRRKRRIVRFSCPPPCARSRPSATGISISIKSNANKPCSRTAIKTLHLSIKSYFSMIRVLSRERKIFIISVSILDSARFKITGTQDVTLYRSHPDRTSTDWHLCQSLSILYK
jgi:hypothetical protein